MRKLLIMASLFYPQKNGGGPPVSIMNVVQAIKGDFDIYIISQNHEVGDTKPLLGIQNGWNEFEFGKVYYFPHGEKTLKNVYNVIDEINPDVIYQNSFFSYDDVIPVLRYKKKNPKVGVVIAPRGEICENRFAGGKLKKTVYIKALKILGMLKNVYFQATGKSEFDDMTKYLGVDESSIYDINNFSYANEKDITSIEKVVGEAKLCYIARIQDTKNLLYAVERLKYVKGNITYDIYGPIENKEYYERCFAVSLPENVRLHYCGFVEHDDVGKTISKYHAYYMPTIGENYGHSIVEGMLYKRPVIISNMTPWNGINAVGGGYALSLDEPKAFETVLDEFCSLNQKSFDSMCEKAKKYIDEQLHIEETIQKYIRCFNEV